MQFGTVTGCCAAYNIYNVGGAHGHKRAMSQEEFEYRFIDKGFHKLNFVITNQYQNIERDYLEKMGFQRQEFPGTGLQMHSISGPDITAYINKRKAELRAWKAEKDKKELNTTLKKPLFAPAGIRIPTLATIGELPFPQIYGPVRPHHVYEARVYFGTVSRGRVEQVLGGYINFRDYAVDIRHALAARLNMAFSCNRISIGRNDDIFSIRRKVYNHCYNRRLYGTD